MKKWSANFLFHFFQISSSMQRIRCVSKIIVADSPSKSAELNHMIVGYARIEALCLDALFPYVREHRA
ncbi:hypothetical protein RIR_jg14492.t1 [Rhizophagus irregularis DAOM 181602=DAOM 197198]|nr:hypothetical protein RIR_jg14492.t1 [Rhizophagus irregularis DAOM 181602=DAOM 197198]